MSDEVNSSSVSSNDPEKIGGYDMLKLSPVDAARQNSYRVPRHPAPADLKLDANEGRQSSDTLTQVLANLHPEILSRYPDRSKLTQVIATQHGLTVDQVLVTAGADEALDRACRAFLQPGRSMIFPSPSFEMIPRFVSWSGGLLNRVQWDQDRFPLKDVLSEIRPDTSLISVVSPNNPTGSVVQLEELRQLSEAAPHALILLDHAYVEFADEDLTSEALRLPNICVFRTLSKAWGLAGARVGYVLGPANVVSWLKAMGQPYSVTTPSIVLAAHWLQNGKKQVEQYVEQVRLERQSLFNELTQLGFKARASQGNFVYAETPHALWLRDSLAGLGIGIRSWPGHLDLGNSIRISCPGEEKSFNRLIQALKSSIDPEAILFDLDGVIADVSESYRQAVIDTCLSYGIEVSRSDIDQIKAQGDANNDWVVSQRLLAQQGIDVPLSEVTDRFEAAYQGEDGEGGLKRHEKMLTDLSTLANLCDGRPTAIVTGRPKRDAIEFLSRFDLLTFFNAIVTMEDAPLKPAPDPVRLALTQLGVTRAWMVGDTVDDIRSAREAEVVPIGILTPSDTQPKETSDSLLRAGAARVLSSLAELVELLELKR